MNGSIGRRIAALEARQRPTQRDSGARGILAQRLAQIAARTDPSVPIADSRSAAERLVHVALQGGPAQFWPHVARELKARARAS